ncbi:hypothetical protein SeMB42_g03822 [Synchytrium endobioticum]|uniref:Helicase ATP-binding domain-containing protein n=2 Tax=Synchytrium endobioticum TaxID=286115 RepID=A0A507D4D0_9FUNG|nr:hypothetical protein SeMB42_g03822 [Synchytrium endobioticum]
MNTIHLRILCVFIVKIDNHHLAQKLLTKGGPEEDLEASESEQALSAVSDDDVAVASEPHHDNDEDSADISSNEESSDTAPVVECNKEKESDEMDVDEVDDRDNVTPANENFPLDDKHSSTPASDGESDQDLDRAATSNIRRRRNLGALSNQASALVPVRPVSSTDLNRGKQISPPRTPISHQQSDDEDLPSFTPESAPATQRKTFLSSIPEPGSVSLSNDSPHGSSYPSLPRSKLPVPTSPSSSDKSVTPRTPLRSSLYPSISLSPDNNSIISIRSPSPASSTPASSLPRSSVYEISPQQNPNTRVPHRRLTLKPAPESKIVDLTEDSPPPSSIQNALSSHLTKPICGPRVDYGFKRATSKGNEQLLHNSDDIGRKFHINQTKARRQIQMIDGKDVPDAFFQSPSESVKREPAKGKETAAADVDSGGHSQSSINVVLNSAPEDDDTMRQELVIPELKIDMLPHQVVGVNWMKNRDIGPTKGGILSDDMGLGKTIQAIALILSNKSTSRHRTTLVVTPLSLLKQWEDELSTKTRKRALRVLIHHGPQRSRNTIRIFEEYDVVLTTYDTVAAEFPSLTKSRKSKKNLDSDDDGDGPVARVNHSRQKEEGPLLQMRWFRVILDEGHNIKNTSTLRSRACCALRTDRRWILSGTPIQNTIEDLQALLKFLQCKPYNDPAQFKADIGEPLKRLPIHVTEEEEQSMKAHELQKIQSERRRWDAALQRVQVVLKIIMLRRQKATLIDGKPLLDLPARNVRMVEYEFTEDERDYYQSLEKKAQKSVKRMKKAGQFNYSNILALLVKLRLSCNHPYLVAFESDNSEDALAKELKKSDDDVHLDDLASMMEKMDVKSNLCTICQEPIEPQSADKLHCSDCAKTFVSIVRASSSMSKNKKNVAMLSELKRTWFSSTKVDALTSTLSNFFKQDATFKAIVFSQFTSFLDIIEVVLVNSGWAFSRYDGSMTLQARDMNLIRARNVIFTKVFWNPYREEQATDRVHRTGQTRDVNVIKMVIRGTVEERIIGLQKSKKHLVEGAIGGASQKNMNASGHELLGLIGEVSRGQKKKVSLS